MTPIASPTVRDDERSLTRPDLHHPPMRLTKWQRFVAGVFGFLTVGAGGASVFLTGNQAGATALLLLGGVAFLMGLTGRVPVRISKEGVEFDRQVAQVVDNHLKDESVPLADREALAEKVREELGGPQQLTGQNVAHAISQAKLAATANTLLLESESLRVIEQNLPAGAKLMRQASIGDYVANAILYPEEDQAPEPSRSVLVHIVWKPTSSRLRRDLDQMARLKPKGIVYITSREAVYSDLASLDFKGTASRLGLLNAHLASVDLEEPRSLDLLAGRVQEIWNAPRPLTSEGVHTAIAEFLRERDAPEPN